ncbi:MAG TPA: hypothetical protein VGL92_12885 [Acidimicrobiia bacterium]
MGNVVECDPVELTSRARTWLEGEPVLHNVICTVLSRATAEPDRFREAGWFAVEEDGDPVGVAIITPPFLLGLTPMSDPALGALVDVLAERRPHLPGAGGPRDVARRFAELWRQRTGAVVTPGMEQQLYRLDALVVPPPAPGSLRHAGEDDRPLLREWFAAFVAETGAIGGDAAGAVDRWLALGGLHLCRRCQPAGAGPGRLGLHALHRHGQPDVERHLPASRLPAGGGCPGIPVQLLIGRCFSWLRRRASTP